MRAALLGPIGQPLTVEDRPDPTPAAGEVVLAVEACGICGSDLHAADALPLEGMVPGHEFCGHVVEVGPGVEGWSVGDRAAGLSLATCGQCVACRTGRPRKCLAARMIGIELPGAYAEHVVLPAHDLVRLPDALDARHGALIEPLAVALHAVERAQLQIGEHALVLGGGPVGLAVALWLRQLGAREVVVSDPVAHRRELALQVGASATVDPTTQDVAGAVVELTGAPPSLVVECVGVAGLLQHATDVAAVDGRVVVAGVCMSAESLVPFVPMMKELDLRFAFYYRLADFTTTVDLIARERIDPLPLVTDEISLDEVPERFEALKHPTEECKVLIRP